MSENTQTKGKRTMNKICPKCGKQHTELENYCTKCGVKLEKEKNVCTEKKTSMCEHRVFEEDDVYCSYCGALTIYGKAKIS